MTRPEWLGTVYYLFASQRTHLEWREVVQAAVQVCCSSKAGFMDAPVMQVAKAAKCGQAVSFEKVAMRFAGMMAV